MRSAQLWCAPWRGDGTMTQGQGGAYLQGWGWGVEGMVLPQENYIEHCAETISTEITQKESV